MTLTQLLSLDLTWPLSLDLTSIIWDHDLKIGPDGIVVVKKAHAGSSRSILHFAACKFNRNNLSWSLCLLYLSPWIKQCCIWDLCDHTLQNNWDLCRSWSMVCIRYVFVSHKICRYLCLVYFESESRNILCSVYRQNPQGSGLAHSSSSSSRRSSEAAQASNTSAPAEISPSSNLPQSSAPQASFYHWLWLSVTQSMNPEC